MSVSLVLGKIYLQYQIEDKLIHNPYVPSWNPDHYIKLHYATLPYITLHCTMLYYTTLHYSTVHYSTLHYTILHSTTPYYTTINYTDTPALFTSENNRDNPFIARQLQSAGRFRAMQWTHRALLLPCPKQKLLGILLRRLRWKWK